MRHVETDKPRLIFWHAFRTSSNPTGTNVWAPRLAGFPVVSSVMALSASIAIGEREKGASQQAFNGAAE